MSKPQTNAIELPSGNYGCPKCQGEQMKMVAHADGPKQFRNIYNCVECGEVITFVYERSKESQVYWE